MNTIFIGNLPFTAKHTAVIDQHASSRRRFSEDDWEVMRSRVRRLGRSGSPAPGLLMGGKAHEAEEETDDQGAPLMLSRCAARTGLLGVVLDVSGVGTACAMKQSSMHVCAHSSIFICRCSLAADSVCQM